MTSSWHHQCFYDIYFVREISRGEFHVCTLGSLREVKANARTYARTEWSLLYSVDWWISDFFLCFSLTNIRFTLLLPTTIFRWGLFFWKLIFLISFVKHYCSKTIVVTVFVWWSMFLTTPFTDMDFAPLFFWHSRGSYTSSCWNVQVYIQIGQEDLSFPNSSLHQIFSPEKQFLPWNVKLLSAENYW